MGFDGDSEEVEQHSPRINAASPLSWVLRPGRKADYRSSNRWFKTGAGGEILADFRPFVRLSTAGVSALRSRCAISGTGKGLMPS
jgi:hypothetical protein